jgi:hypothetical protein
VTAAAAPSARSRVVPWILLAVAVVGIGLVGRNGRHSGAPLDPRSTDPSGARGLVLLLKRFGAEVRVTSALPPAGGTAVLLQDRLGAAPTARLRRWVQAGGTLVVADPQSSLSPALARGDGGLFSGTGTGDGTLRDEACALPPLAGVRRLSVPDAAGSRVRDDAVGCYPAGAGSFVVARPLGLGTVVALGGAGVFTNEALDEAENGALAVALMAPRSGTSVHLLTASAPGSGREKLLDLVDRRIKDALWQLLVAMACVALWRARRLGRPQLEPQAVEIDASELVVAVGNLLQQGKRRAAAAAMGRSPLRRARAHRLGRPIDAPAEALAEAASFRAGADADAVRSALSSGAPPDDEHLVVLARTIENLRNEVVRAR